jgi:hypothetical protein
VITEVDSEFAKIRPESPAYRPRLPFAARKASTNVCPSDRVPAQPGLGANFVAFAGSWNQLMSLVLSLGWFRQEADSDVSRSD